ncbi:hypothetical protein [Brevundimonas sp. NIBR11]|uniref:hypothetical protein n=1 Tax=Brevundimonas sp. NIBR11 TaxID=3015999 RepID=UPI0022F0C265|nr:hypothetical protein [Brevundimonas sp. NIBR11]WGM32252.1 hypothetical protein KKHFBJBL_02503 [Brevundimonas sp. NIBR11]
MGAIDIRTDETGTFFALPGGVTVRSTDDRASPLLGRFFEGYDRAFVLPNEREELDGFEACLDLNRTHRHAFGRIQSEQVVVLEDETGQRVGGINFLATAVGNGRSAQACVALNYVYVEADARGRGLLRQCLTAVRTLAPAVLGLAPDAPAPAIFIEQNDPLCLTAEEYAADTEHSGLDQLDRLAIWARVGARVVDFPYVQPALSADQEADDGLIYAAVDYPGDAVPAALLHDHLQSFFGISVLKGAAGPVGGDAARQISALAGRTAPVPLLRMEPALGWLRSGRDAKDFDSFRDLARETAG